jgi:hypothetical protein
MTGAVALNGSSLRSGVKQPRRGKVSSPRFLANQVGVVHLTKSCK